MRIGLADVKKRIARREGELTVRPHLLGPRELARELEALIALYEAWLGRERSAFPLDRPAELIGDYRLARCLEICLEEAYEWQPIAWPGPATPEEARALAAREIASPSHLRLALYDAVNATGGYLAAADRDAALDAFAAGLLIGRATLDALLWLDAEERAVLARTAEALPTPNELVRRYNQQVVEALLANSSHVEWRIPPEAADGAGGGLGTVVKRVCFLARRLGVQYDVAFADAFSSPLVGERPGEKSLARVAERPALYVGGDAAPEVGSGALDRRRTPVCITLYGPQEVTGAPQQYGERLARLCRALLGYRRQAQEAGQATLGGAGIAGTARVYVRGQPMTFALDDRVLKLLAPNPPTVRGEDTARNPDPAFDSSVEQRLYDEFSALERAGEAHGWRLEREPEPVLVGETILVPDFALTRGLRRVYLEIAGYWRPEYRERKLRKLQAVRGAVDLVVAAPETSQTEFAPLGGDIPLVWYRNALGASALLTAVDAAYDDFVARLAALDAARIGREVRERGVVPPVEGMVLLHSHTRAEVAKVLASWAERRTEDESLVWVDGLGLAACDWLDTLLERVRWRVLREPDGRLPLATLLVDLRGEVPELREATESAVETLVALAGLRVARSSLFLAEALAPDAIGEAIPSPHTAAGERRRTQPRRVARRKHSEDATAQQLFPSSDLERTGDDGA